jgi:hypothetical protein
MNAMSIRQYLKRRVWWCAGIAFAGWLMFPLGAAIAKNLPEGVSQAAVPMVGFALFFGAIIALQRLVRCPNCQARLGQTIAMPLALSWGSGPKVSFCPFCGVNLDESVPQAQGPLESQNPIK